MLPCGTVQRWLLSSPWPSWRSPPSSPADLCSHPQSHADAQALRTEQRQVLFTFTDAKDKKTKQQQQEDVDIQE